MLFFGSMKKGLEEYRNTPSAVLVDVRERDEFAGGHIPGAVNVPVAEIAGAGLSRDASLFLYCLSGARSSQAAGILKRMGYTKVKSIGGIMSYRGELEGK